MRCFQLTAGRSSVQQPPAHLLAPESAVKGQRELLPRCLLLYLHFPRSPTDLHCSSAPPEFSKSSFQTALADFGTLLTPPGLRWDHILFHWTIKNRWISSDVALLLWPVFISPVTQFIYFISFPFLGPRAMFFVSALFKGHISKTLPPHLL